MGHGAGHRSVRNSKRHRTDRSSRVSAGEHAGDRRLLKDIGFDKWAEWAIRNCAADLGSERARGSGTAYGE
jgi:hypothetical protein